MPAATVLRGHNVRTRKLNPRANLPIIREKDLDGLDDDPQRNVPALETGIEKHEESEHHLQKALHGKDKSSIPTPQPTKVSIQDVKLYPLTFSQPASYIRFSSTVEDCTGCPYDLDDDDAAFLTAFNNKKNAATQCSENYFEEVMNVFEETAYLKQPYSAVDNPPVLAWDEIEPLLEDNLEDHAKPFAKGIYEHWRSKRSDAGNRSLITSLKFETGADTDDADPYVCFRRREVRQIRKTRGRDAHSAEKLKKLRKELEEARDLVALIRQREMIKRESLATDRALFEQRASLRGVKQSLPDQYRHGDEDLLINQKKKKTTLELPQRPPGSQLGRLPARSDGRPTEAELYTLQDVKAEEERRVQEDIDQRIAAHARWNEGWVDLTKAPITPPLETGVGSTFRTATTEYLPTPPASISSEQSADGTGNAARAMSQSRKENEVVAVRYASPSYDGPYRGQPSFRRRYGRGGRLWIDRRGMRFPHPRDEEGDSPMSDRFRFDDEDEEETPTYFIDPFDADAMKARARLFPSMPIQAQQQQQLAARRAQQEALAAAAAMAGNGVSVQGGSSGLGAAGSQRRQSGD